MSSLITTKQIYRCLGLIILSNSGVLAVLNLNVTFRYDGGREKQPFRLEVLSLALTSLLDRKFRVEYLKVHDYDWLSSTRNQSCSKLNKYEFAKRKI